MKKILTFFIAITVLVAKAQEKNSLLWKISGNGLQKDSYLFGTMHVSEKIAFHLDDVFFEALQKSDFVALETDPTYWLDYFFEGEDIDTQYNSFFYRNQNDFYNTPFKLLSPKQEEIMFFLSREDMLLNGILYRTDPTAQNFQEETYLDMFIFQAGKRFGKKIYSLEDFERASYLVKKANGDPLKEKPDLWLQKKLKDENYFNLIRNSYRDRNTPQLDSLYAGMYTEDYLNNILYIRNRDMVNSLEKIVTKGSLFAAVGAAHLDGEKGMINMLRQKGYTLTPLLSKQTEKGKQQKKQIEDKIVEVPYTKQTSADGFFSANVPNKLYELRLLNNTVYLSPDLINGSHVVVTRINTFEYLHGKDKIGKVFNKLLTETIPGKIISKTPIKKGNYDGLDIVNETKTGDFQRYQLFFTPIEIIIFKMDGKKDFVKKYGNQFFDSITFNKTNDDYVKVSPTHKGFEVAVPNQNSFVNKSFVGNRVLQAYNNKDEFFFVQEVVLNDNNYIEEDSFEIERIQERFYKWLKLKYKGGSFKENSNHKSFESTTVLDTIKGKNLYLKSVTNAGHYYLLGYVSKEAKRPNRFFDSFTITPITYKQENFEIQKDTSLYFSVKSVVKPTFKNFYTKYHKKQNKKKYKSFFRMGSYVSRGNEEVNVELRKKHDLASYENIDSLWKNLRYKENKHLKKLNSKTIENISDFLRHQSFKVANEKKGITKNNNHFYSYLLKDSLSSKAVKVKYIVAKGAVYELKSLIDTAYTQSDFITNFYETFTPKDTILGKSLFKNKNDLFFKALKSKDSLALDGYNQMSFKKSDVKELIDVISNFKFEDNQQKIKEHLVKELAKIKTSKAQKYLEELYVTSFDNPYNQIAIVESVINDKTEKSYQKLLKLFELDIPLTSNSYNITSMMANLNDSLNVSKKLYPKLLNYATIDEYKKPIYTLLSKLLEKEKIKPSNYQNFKTQILNEARIELKRQLSKKISESTSTYSGYNSGRYFKDDLLNIYVKLLFPFRKDKNVQNFLSKLKYTNNHHVKSTYVTSQLKHDKKYDKNILKGLFDDVTKRGVLYESLDKINRTDLFPSKYASKKEVYKALLFKNRNVKKLKDSILFLGKRDFTISDKKFQAYFYKSKPHENADSYQKDWKLGVYAFKVNEDKEVNVKPYHSEINGFFDETKKLEEIIEENIEKIKLKGRKRVNLAGRRNYNY